MAFKDMGLDDIAQICRNVEAACEENAKTFEQKATSARILTDSVKFTPQEGKFLAMWSRSLGVMMTVLLKAAQEERKRGDAFSDALAVEIQRAVAAEQSARESLELVREIGSMSIWQMLKLRNRLRTGPPAC